MDLFSTFHNLTKTLTTAPTDATEWPDTWKLPQYKTYHGAKVHTLPSPDAAILEGKTLNEVLLKRRTGRQFNHASQVSMQELGDLLAYSCGEIQERIGEKNRRIYASAGALYPLEVYVITQAPLIDGSLDSGIYHYRPDIHALEELSLVSPIHPEELFVYEWAAHTPLIICITAVFERTVQKYGYRGYRFALIEAGEVLTNMSLCAAACGYTAAIIGGTQDTILEDTLDVDGIAEALLSVMVLGKESN